MAVINRIAGYSDDMTAWRQHLHQHPELGFDCYETAGFVVKRLREFGVDQIETGIATSGVVAIIEGQGEGPTIGLRADMDALPIEEQTGADYASKTVGKMHACGHDGHTTMLLGAARYLAETRNFRGRVALIFQPAEEGPGGGEVMIDEGIMERFGIDQVFAMHTNPWMEEGKLASNTGAMMAAVDTFHIDIKGSGGHGASPHNTHDPVVAACGMVQSIQTIVSRNHDGRKDLVLSVTQIHTGSAENIVPETAYVNGTIRTFDETVRTMVHERLKEIVAGLARGYGVEAELRVVVGYPATINHVAPAEFALDVAREVVGEANVNDAHERSMGSEDFSYMLQARPGAYVCLGQGLGPSLHHPKFDFNDAVAPIGASFFARLVERAQPVG
ncbi:MAG: M20 aminoacylase family protein [Pseudomonadota bacterium]